MGFKDEDKKAKKSSEEPKGHGTLSRSNSHSSFSPTEDDDEDEDKNLELGPRIALKEQLEKDKDDESLRRWKEQLLGIVDLEEVGVYGRKQMLRTFSPQAEPYNHVMFEESTPSGMLGRGSYSVKSKFVDDDNKCYLENNYTFDIRKNWL
ncbi:hypothetical protein Bca4012_053774 [Brassica carinata]